MMNVYCLYEGVYHSFKRTGLFLLVGLLSLVIYVPTAQATHFRYGNLSWRQLPSDPTGRTIEFKLTMGFRLGYFTPTPTVGSTIANTTANPSSPFNYGDGSTITNFNFTVTSVNTTDDYLYAEAVLTHTYSTNGTYTAFLESSARLSTLQNNANGRYRIPSTVNVGSTNLPPISTLPPIINLPFGQAAAAFTVPATDPNGNTLTFSLATAADLGATYTFAQPTSMTVSSTGQATFDTRSPRAVGQLYNAVIKISDGQSFVVVDFLIRIVAASEPPVFTYGNFTPANNSTIQTYVGCPINFTVRATDTDPTSNTITLQAVGLPPGATFSPVTASNTVTSAFSFLPTTEGTSVTSFFAQDNVGNQAITSVTFRVLQPMLTASPAVVCVGTPISLTATPGTSASGVTNYTFRGPNGIIGSTGTTNTATVSGLAAGVYSFSVTTTNSVNSNTACTSTAITSVTVDAPPTATLTASGTLTCSATSVTLTASSTTEATSYTFRGPGLNQNSSANTAVVSQSGTYSVVVTTASGCTALATTSVFSNTTAPAAPGVSVQQPTCTLATGTISVTAPTGTGLTYSIDGTTYTSVSTFSGLGAGIYSVTVRNAAGCTSASTSVTINAQPSTPVTPTATVTQQPNCTLATGTITVSAPTGAGLTYSIDGTIYTNTTGIFTGVAPGSYSVRVRNAAGCTSAPTSVTVNAQPPTPVAPTVAVTQPTCTVATGTITVSAPTGTGLTYSIDGSTYTNTTGVFSGVTPGVYSVTVRNSSGCTSVPTSVTVNAQPPTPSLTLTSATVCAGVSTTLTVSGCTGGTPRWSTGDNTTSLVVVPLVTTVYSATCTGASGCSATASATVTIRPTPTYSGIPAITPATCTGTVANANARISITGLQNTERADISIGSTYSGPAYGAASNQLVAGNAVNFTNLPNPASPQPYTIRLFSAQGGCTTDVVVLLSPADCRCPTPGCVRVAIIPPR